MKQVNKYRRRDAPLKRTCANCRHWREVSQDQRKWHHFVSEAKTHSGSLGQRSKYGTKILVMVIRILQITLYLKTIIFKYK